MSNLILFGIMFIFLVMMIVSKLFLNEENKHMYISVILLSLISTISINMGINQFIIERVENLYIQLTFFIMIMIFLLTINYRTFAISLDNIALIIILVQLFLAFKKGYINNEISFYQMVILYTDIFLISIIYKNIGNIKINKVLELFNYIAIFNGILGILQFITGKKLLLGIMNESIYYNQGLISVKRVVGIAGTNNSGGDLGAILFCVTFFNYMRNRRKVDLYAVISSVIFTILTLTRIGYLSIIVQLIIYFFISNWSTVREVIAKIKIILCTGIILGGIIFAFGNQIYDLLVVQRGNTANSRITQFQRIDENILTDYDFYYGIGAGQYRYYSYYFLGYNEIEIHSQYLNVLVEQGGVIFIVFVIFNINIFIKAIRKCDDILEKAFIAALFIGNLICANYNPNQEYIVNNILYYILMYLYFYKEKGRVVLKEET